MIGNAPPLAVLAVAGIICFSYFLFGYRGVSFRKLLGSKTGATAIEYGLIAALVSVAGIVALEAMGTSLKTMFESETTINGITVSKSICSRAENNLSDATIELREACVEFRARSAKSQ